MWHVAERNTYSSAVMALYSIVSSRYSRRQAGHKPLRLVLMLLKQNWQIYLYFCVPKKRAKRNTVSAQVNMEGRREGGEEGEDEKEVWVGT